MTAWFELITILASSINANHLKATDAYHQHYVQTHYKQINRWISMLSMHWTSEIVRFNATKYMLRNLYERKIRIHGLICRKRKTNCNVRQSIGVSLLPMWIDIHRRMNENNIQTVLFWMTSNWLILSALPLNCFFPIFPFKVHSEFNENEMNFTTIAFKFNIKNGLRASNRPETIEVQQRKFLLRQVFLFTHRPAPNVKAEIKRNTNKCHSVEYLSFNWWIFSNGF